MSHEPLPCPFCGFEDTETRFHEIVGAAWTECLNCGCRGPRAGFVTSTADAERAAIEVWNRRANSTRTYL